MYKSGPPDAVAIFLGSLHNAPPKVERREFLVTVNPFLSIRDLVIIIIGGEDHYCHTERNLKGSLKVTGTTSVQVKIEAFRLNQKVTLKQARRARKCLGLKPIGWDHQAALAIGHKFENVFHAGIINIDTVLYDFYNSYQHGCTGHALSALVRNEDNRWGLANMSTDIEFNE